MENLNAEKVKKALEIHTGILDKACEECPYNRDAHDEICLDVLVVDTLALITSQEQRIKELTEEKNEVFEKGAENLNRVEEAYLKLEAENLKLTEENERLRADCVKGVNALIEEIQKNRTIEADTVMKMHSMLCEGRVSNDNVVIVANQIAKEVLEGKNEIKTNSEHS